jgi:hypothetical protein
MAINRREQFIADALSSSSDDCIIWPFAVRKSSGYGAHCISLGARANKKNLDSHRYVCALAHGEPETGMQAAHRCGNKLCVNPSHLYWADAKTNMADAKAHGTLVGGGIYRQRLFEKEINEIVTSSDSLIALGKRFGMDPAYIGKVRRKYSSVSANG